MSKGDNRHKDKVIVDSSATDLKEKVKTLLVNIIKLETLVIQ